MMLPINAIATKIHKGALTSCSNSARSARLDKMASYHCSIKPVSRGSGRSGTAAAAYRAGECIADERTGEVHDYTRKQGVEYTALVLPDGVDIDRGQLWNAAEAAEKRKDARIAREFEIALPAELTPEQRRDLAVDFAKSLVDRYGVAADVAVHDPNRKGDQRNHHAHILITTRQISAQGLGDKTDLEREDKALRSQGKPSGRDQVKALRVEWATRCNAALERAGHNARIDHRTLDEQGIDREPSTHLGPVATAMERRGMRTVRGDMNRELTQVNELIKSLEIARRELEVVSVEESPAPVSEPVRGTGTQPEGNETPQAPMLPPIEANKMREYTESTVQSIVDFIKNSESYEKVREILDLVKRDSNRKVLWQTVSMAPELIRANEKVRACGELLWQANKQTEKIAIEIAELGMVASMSYKLGKHEICQRENDAAEQKARASNEMAKAKREVDDIRTYLTSPASDFFKAVESHNKRAEQAERACRVIMPVFHERRKQHENEIAKAKKRSKTQDRGL